MTFVLPTGCDSAAKPPLLIWLLLLSANSVLSPISDYAFLRGGAASSLPRLPRRHAGTRVRGLA